MTRRMLGPYEIEAVLAKGRFGTVHRARVAGPGGALTHGRAVVVKVLDADLMESLDARQDFLRDALPARMVRHANVVRTHDAAVAEEDGEAVFFVVAEPVRGKTARSVVRALGRVAEALLRELALGAAAGLAAIHAQEIVHLALSPENLILTDDHRVRILDLGVGALSTSLIRRVREGEEDGRRLVRYAAPEQRGAAPDAAEPGPAADLYALGAVLYELATGVHPDDALAQAESAAAAAGAPSTRSVEPPPAETLTPELSPFFSAVLAKLLRRDPARRFPSAAALHALLQQGEASSWWAEQEVRLRGDGRLPRRVRPRSPLPLAGREPELTALRERLARAEEGSGQAILIEGVAGVGKTHLLLSFAGQLDPATYHVLHGTYSVRGGRGGISMAVVRHLGLNRLEPELRRLLPLTPDLVPGVVASFHFPDLPPGSARPPVGDALHAVFVQLMQSLADEKPVVWVLDDLQFASRESVALLHSMVRAAGDRRVLLVATGRPGVQGEAFASLDRIPHFRRMPLAPLSPEGVDDLLAAAAGSPVGKAWSGEIGVRSGGVPFTALQILAWLRQSEGFAPPPGGKGLQPTDALAGLVANLDADGLLARRLQGLPAGHRSLLDVAAVQGTRFDPELVAAAMGTSTVSALLRLAEVEYNLGLVDLAGRDCAFLHHLIHEEIDRALPRAIRSEYHALLADAIRARGRSPLDGSEHHSPGATVALAHHGLRGSRPLEAGPYVAPAMDHLWHAHRNPQALEIGRRALAVPRLLDGRPRLDVLVRTARSLEILGEYDEHRRVIDEALEVADALGEPLARARILRLRGVREADQGDHEAAVATFEEARQVAEAQSDRFFEAQLREHLGKSTAALERYDQASLHFERYLGVIRETKDARRQGETLANLARVAYKRGQLKVARAQYERALDFLRKSSDSTTLVRALAGQSLVLLRLGELDAARDTLRQHLDLSRRLGLRSQEPFARINLAALYSAYGEPGRAREHLAAHRALARELGDERMEAVAVANLGSVHRSLGDGEAAREALSSALDTFERLARPGWVAFALHELARVEEDAGALDDAERLHRQALDVRRRLEQQAEVAQSLISLTRVDVARGLDAAARWSAEEAFALSREFDAVGEQMLAGAYLALHGGMSVRDALEVARKSTRRATFEQKLETAYVLWRATSDPVHLEEAHNLLRSFCAKTPPDEHDRILRNVLVHRWIHQAWQRHAPPPDADGDPD